MAAIVPRTNVFISVRWWWRWWWCALVWISSSPSSAATTPADKEEEEAAAAAAAVASPDHGILAWMHASEGGFYNPKTEFRRAAPDNPLLGVFAKERIEEGEVLCRVPWDMLIAGNEGYMTEEESDRGDFSCATAKALAAEMELGDDSKFKPYVNYLKNQRGDQIPSAWSKQGQELLLTVLGSTNATDKQADTQIPPNDPLSWLDDEADDILCHLETPMERKAAWMVIQRADDALIIPAYDMYNHRNGKRWMNARTDIHHDISHETKALRTIEAGEQIHISYNMCHNCGGRKDYGYGTASILRDYGFVEPFPQRWVYKGFQFDLDDEDDDGQLEVTWHRKIKKKSKTKKEKFRIWLKGQVRRLRRLWNIDWAHKEREDHGIPLHEWQTIWQFQRANVVAMTAALLSLDEIDSLDDTTTPPMNKTDADMTCSWEDWKGDSNNHYDSSCSDAMFGIPQNHFDSLQDEMDDVDYNEPTCDNEEILEFEQYFEYATMHSSYQFVEFFHDPDTDDICMFKGDIVEVCSSFGPKQYELPLRTAARFLNDGIRRVLFLGEETPMLLTEILKLDDNIELVVGIVEDQALTRTASRYFEMSPKFEDDRVDWWFGNARDTLALLPAEYWGSFDLVYVGEVSDSIASFYNSSRVEVLRGLGMLLKKDGILVKSQLFMDEMSEAFKYSAHFVHDQIPFLCSEPVTMGSPNVDFFHHQLQHVDGEGREDRLETMQGYRQREIQPGCSGGDDGTFSEIYDVSAGLLEILDGISSDMTMDMITAAIERAIQQAGLTPHSPVFVDNTLAFAVMEEGYIAGRFSPDNYYIGFDIYLWSSMHHGNILRASLVASFKGIPFSSLRVIVGGTNQISGQQDVLQLEACTEEMNDIEDSPRGPEDEAPIVYTAVIDAVVAVVDKKEIVALVLCGDEAGTECLTSKVLERHQNVSSTIVLRTCSGIEDSRDPLEMFEEMIDCEKEIANKLRSGNSGKIDMVVVDDKSSFSMKQIMNSILSISSDREAWLSDEHILLAISSNSSKKSIQSNFLDRHRRRVQRFPVAKAEISISGSTTDYEVGVVSVQDLAVGRVSSVEHELSRILKVNGLDGQVHRVKSGLFPFDAEFDTSHFEYNADDIVNVDQFLFSEEMPFGVRQIVHFAAKDQDEAFEASLKLMQKVVKLALTDADFDFAQFQPFQQQVGNILISAYSSKDATAILIWDGLLDFDLTVFPSTQFNGFAKIFRKAMSKIFEVQFRTVSDSHAKIKLVEESIV